MAIVLYDLAGGDGRRFSPHCWRTRLALAHKQLEFRDVPTLFTEIAEVADGRRQTLPVIEDGDTVLEDSWTIAEYLEDSYPDRPSLFGGATGKALTAFTQSWTVTELQRPIGRMLVKEIHDILDPRDQPYFRESREARLGESLEAVHSRRETLLPHFQAKLAPLRRTLADRPFLAGDAPAYADYVVFGALQWARCCSALRLLPEDAGEIPGWMDRIKQLYDGMATRQPAFW